ncbi:MAG: ASKHA domain-containing protein [candidate division WOR-3 bacterium]
MVIKVRPRQGQNLRELLLQTGIPVPGDCGGNGTCGKCRVLVDGRPVLACRFIPQKPVPVAVDLTGAGETPPPRRPKSAQLRLAADIGTTTIALAAVDRLRKRIQRQETMLNPQTRYGADVLSRIVQAAEVKKIRLAELLARYGEEIGLDRRHPIIAVGNTVMMHFLFGENPASLGTYPYRSCLPLKKVISVRCESLLIRTLPLLGSFIGSDCTAAILASGLYQSRRPCLLIDAGTNGELVLGNRERLIACSTAAGPAFEGATLECGSLARSGAIRACRYRPEGWKLITVRNRPPVAICGSGVLDAVAEGLKAGLIMPSGRLRTGDRLLLHPDEQNPVYLSQSDLREIQLAKAAIAAGIRILLRRWFGTDRPESTMLDRIFITGRFGNRINPDSAFTIGLLPHMETKRIRQHPDLALAGAVRATINPELLETATAIADRCEEIMLAKEPEFEELFIECMELKPWS